MSTMKRPDCPDCGAPMQKIGKQGKAKRQRWRCPSGCLDTIRPDKPQRRPPKLRLRLIPNSTGWELRYGEAGFPLHQNNRGRWRVHLGKGHPYANSGGWQYLYRFVVADALGHLPGTDEHVHHCNEDHRNITNNLDHSRLELVLAEFHGQLHATHTTLATPSQLSRHVLADNPGPTRQALRWRAIIGPASESEPLPPR